jgi:hypothetical protein
VQIASGLTSIGSSRQVRAATLDGEELGPVGW